MRTYPTNIVEERMLDRIVLGDFPINFQRTTRVPEVKLNYLPAGLGSFPIYRVADFKAGCPKDWKEQGYFMPMYPQEAMWMNFGYGIGEPRALIVAAGNINAVTGKQIQYKETERGETLEIILEEPQNYVVIPPQPWLDGWKAPDDKIYQFVAAELGSGETVEGQITGKEEVGGIQLVVYKPKPGQDLIPESRPHEFIKSGSCYKSLIAEESLGVDYGFAALSAPRSMGLGRGGEIIQKIYPDPYGLNVWEENPADKTILYLVSSEDFKQITGVAAPPTPVPYKEYQQKQMPWFGLPDQEKGDTKGSDIFEKLKPVGEGKASKKKIAKKGGKNAGK